MQTEREHVTRMHVPLYRLHSHLELSSWIPFNMFNYNPFVCGLFKKNKAVEYQHAPSLKPRVHMYITLVASAEGASEKNSVNPTNSDAKISIFHAYTAIIGFHESFGLEGKL